MLSLFEQDYFIDENFIKKYPYSITNKHLKKMLDTLVYIATDPHSRRVMQEEYWAAMNESLWEKEVQSLNYKIETQSNQIEALQQLLKQAGIEIPFTE
jgi:hypothetical protein